MACQGVRVTSTSSRRTVLRASAWSTPLVVAVAAAPAHAASVPAAGLRLDQALAPVQWSLSTRGIQFTVTNLTTTDLAVVVTYAESGPGGAVTVPLYGGSGHWTHERAGGQYIVRGFVAASSTSPPFTQHWGSVSAAGVAETALLTVAAPGLPPLVVAVPLRFDVPLMTPGPGPDPDRP